MRAAPPVAVDLGAGRRERVLAALLWGTSAGVFGTWLLEAFAVGLPVQAIPLVALAAAACAWQSLRPMTGRLAWDGRVWRWQPPGRPPCEVTRVQRALDLGPWVMLRCDDGSPRGLWCGMSAAQAGDAWHGLQLALRNRARAPASGTER